VQTAAVSAVLKNDRRDQKNKLKSAE